MIIEEAKRIKKDYIDLKERIAILQERIKFLKRQAYGSKDVSITALQKVALHALLTCRGVNYYELIHQTFAEEGIDIPSRIPPMDELTRQQTLLIIRYGNKKYIK